VCSSDLTLLVLIGTIGLNVYLFDRVPKGFFPQQDTGRMSGQILADQDTSFQSMDKTLLQMVNIVAADPGVDTVNGFTGGGGGGGGGASTLNQGRMFISLRPLAERKITVDFIMQRLRPKLARIPGATLYLQSSQDLRVGGRNSAALYQFTMRGDNLEDLITFAPQMFRELKSIPIIVDVNSDQQNRGLQSMVVYDRETAARFGISPQLIDNTLYDAFGQRQVSTMYKSLNQYHVVMEAAPRYWQDPQTLRDIYIRAPGGQQVPLSAIAHHGPAVAPLSVNHQGLFPSVTISFNLQPGVALGDAVEEIGASARKIGLPPTIQTMFTGTAQAYQDSLGSEPYLIAAALMAVYLMLGVLYESYIHPVTIL
jgi:multidrug efflux pump